MPREQEQDVMLKSGDMLWMEIAETPQSLRNKLPQLDCAFRFFPSEKNKGEFLPCVAVVCLGGEKKKI